MLIYFNGDSNVAGTELEFPETQGFAGKLAKKINANIINQATPGASNSKILRTTEEYIRQCKSTGNYPDFMIIGWSEFTREDWFINGSYQSLNTFDLAIPENIDADRFNYWKKNQGHDGMYQSQIPKFWNTAIHNFHCELNFLNIPHLFFNTIQSFCVQEDLLKDQCDWSIIYRLDWKGRYFRPYESKFPMIKWLENSGHEQITPGLYHYGEPAQTEWSNILYDYIKENNLI